MDSISRQMTQEKISRTYDTAAGSQATSKGLKEYVRDLRKGAGLKDHTAGTAQDFLRDFGKGI